MLRKLRKQNEPKNSACPAFALGCDKCSPISILKPEIVIEERRWLPYPLVIRHYIPKQKSKDDNCFKKLYCKCKNELQEWEERRRDRRRAKEAAERIERERCLKELRRLHSYHQRLCCNTQSFASFSRAVKKDRPKSRTATQKKEKKSKPGQFLCLRYIGNAACVIFLLTAIGMALIVLV